MTQTDTGARFVITGRMGAHSRTAVGPYKLAAKLNGFRSFEQTGIVLAVGSTRSVNVALKVGGVSETVLVEADAAQVETRSIGLGQVVPQEQIIGLPLNGRSALQLIVLAGGAVEAPGLTDDRQYPGAVAIAVQGGPATAQYSSTAATSDPQNNTEARFRSRMRSRSSASKAASKRALRDVHRRHGQRRDQVWHERVPRRLFGSRATTDNAIRYSAEGEQRHWADDGERNQPAAHSAGRSSGTSSSSSARADTNNHRPLNNDVTVPTQKSVTAISAASVAACRGGTAHSRRAVRQ